MQLGAAACARVQAALLLSLLARPAHTLAPLSDWRNGIATYYGGPADKMDPYSPSYGTKDVRPSQLFQRPQQMPSLL